MYYSHNFGHKGPLDFHGLGINGKISELQAAMGLAVFPHMNTIIENRKIVTANYLGNLDFNHLQSIKIRENTKWNYSYFPVIFESEEKLLQVQNALNSENIFPRRYFYPSLNTISFVDGKTMPVSESIASRILCLPMYSGLEKEDVNRIIKLINQTL
jgi:dTDP-4-amino-4,6-dideoxygalactose transaminase